MDGAIHRAGGPDIMAECRRIGGCPTGDAVRTTAGRLPADRVIHTVGPIWSGGNAGEPDLLASAYRRSLQVAAAHGARTCRLSLHQHRRLRLSQRISLLKPRSTP